MFSTISLAPGVLRWWVAALAYSGALAVLIGVSLSPLPAEIGQATVFIGYIFLASVIAYVFAKGKAADNLGLSQPQNRRRVIALAMGIAAILLLLSELAAQFNADIARSTETFLTTIGFGSNRPRDLLIIATICCFAPLGEEALYRGLIFRSLFNALHGSGAWPAALIAATLAALLFAFSHGGEGQEASVLAIIFLSGLLYGLIYALTGALAAPILAHSLNNAAALALFAFPAGDIPLLSKLFIALSPLLTWALIWLWARLLAGARGALPNQS